MIKTPVILTSEIKATLIDQMGNDDSIVHAARVSIVGARAETEGGEKTGLLNFLMKNRHASPFEHVTATFMIECPIFVTREVHRHRTFSYNEVSGRYSVLEPKFYIPRSDRPLTQVGKPGAYRFEEGTDEQFMLVLAENRFCYQTCWNSYEHMLENGIAKEVARDILPVGVFTAFYMTGSLRNWFNFLSLRTAPDALFEIRDLAGQIEEALIEVAPISMELWAKNDRNSL